MAWHFPSRVDFDGARLKRWACDVFFAFYLVFDDLVSFTYPFKDCERFCQLGILQIGFSLTLFAAFLQKILTSDDAVYYVSVSLFYYWRSLNSFENRPKSWKGSGNLSPQWLERRKYESCWLVWHYSFLYCRKFWPLTTVFTRWVFHCFTIDPRRSFNSFETDLKAENAQATFHLNG